MKRLHNVIKRKLKEDRQAWLDKLVNSLMSNKEAWKGLKILGSCYKSRMVHTKVQTRPVCPTKPASPSCVRLFCLGPLGDQNDPEWNDEVLNEVREKLRAKHTTIRRCVL